MTAPEDSAGTGRRFHLIERLGSGAGEEVYLADLESAGGLRRRVTLKLFRSRRPSHELRDEVRLLGRLNHRSIAAVLELVRIGDSWALVTEALNGPDLGRVVSALRVQRRHLSPRAAFEIASGIGEALDAAWNGDGGSGRPPRVVHRDIKPSNVLLTRDGEVKVFDFGMTRIRRVESGALAAPGQAVRFLAPERGPGRPSQPVLPSSDVYALGATLVELLTGGAIGAVSLGAARHTATVDKVAGVVKAALASAPDPEAVEEAVGLIRAALDADPERRPTARAFGERCASIAQRLDGEALRPFARAFVPRVDGLLGRSASLTSRVLIASPSSAAPAPRRIARGSAAWRIQLAVLAVLAVVVASIGAATLVAIALSTGLRL